MNQAVDIAHKLYTCRDQQIFLAGEEKFKASVERYKPAFTQVMEEKKCSEVAALTTLVERAQANDGTGMLTHILCAVACELMEPTVTKEAA